jgi:TPR repeat protein
MSHERARKVHPSALSRSHLHTHTHPPSKHINPHPTLPPPTHTFHGHPHILYPPTHSPTLNGRKPVVLHHQRILQARHAHLGRQHRRAVAGAGQTLRARPWCRWAQARGGGRLLSTRCRARKRTCPNDLGRCYESGIGVAKDIEAAVYHYRLSATKGNRRGMYNLGRCYQRAIGLGANPSQAFRWYRKAASKGHRGACVKCAKYFQTGFPSRPSDPEQAVFYFRKAAELNSMYAARQLAHCYERGVGTTLCGEEAECEALRWYQRGADLGGAWSLCYVGEYHEEGRGGMACDPEYALRCYQRSSERGCARAKARLATCLEHGVSKHDK